MKRVGVFLCVALLAPSLGACSTAVKHAREIGKASSDYKQANDQFAAHQAENAAKAEAGWTNGVALYDTYMAAPAPSPATTIDEARAWHEERYAIIVEADQHFADVQVYEDAGARGYMTHIKLGEMERRLIDELVGFEASLSADDGRTMHATALIVLIEDALKHYDAWDGAYAEFDDGTLERELSGEIARARDVHAELEVAFERCGKIVMGDLPTAAAGDA
ncbi:MAG: hypothetical protein KC486_16790 [Myxococcales bacterium]|nr:hypothetical protein [Myxococcales bacterium]